MLQAYLLLTAVTAIQSKMEHFIVGGTLVEIEKYPYAAFMMIKCTTDTKPKFSKCGASILNQRLLLTAAHCIARCRSRTTISITIGNKNREDGIIMSAEGYIVHEHYDPVQNIADIAIVKMSKPAKFSSRVNRVAIMKTPPYEEPAFLAGWGTIDEYNRIFDDNLKELEQTVYRRPVCLKILQGRLPKGTFCASNTQQNGFASGGDSGAGLVVRGYILIGLVSSKIPDTPDVTIYTDIGYFYDWITFNARRLYCFNHTNY